MPLSEYRHIISSLHVIIIVSSYINRQYVTFRALSQYRKSLYHHQSIITSSEVSIPLSGYRHIISSLHTIIREMSHHQRTPCHYQSIITLSVHSLYHHIIIRVSTYYQHNFHFHYHHSTMIFLYLHYHFYYSSPYTSYSSFSPPTCTTPSFLTSAYHSLVFPVISLFLFCHFFRTFVQRQHQRKIVNIGVGFPAILNDFHGKPSV